MIEILKKIFICSCDKNHGIDKIDFLQSCSITGQSRIVGRCLKCRRRVHATIFITPGESIKSYKGYTIMPPQ